MTERLPEDVLRELEGDTTNRRFGRDQVLREIAEDYEREGDEEAAEKARIEATAFEHHTTQKNKAFPGYFQPWWISIEGQTAPPLDFFNEERLGYLAERARTVSNPIHAARFPDVVWDLARPKDPEMAKLAIRKYLECADLYRVNGWGPDFGDVIKRATALATMIRDQSLLSIVKERILRCMRELDSAQEYQFCQDLSSALKEARRMELNDAEWREVLDILDRAAAYYREEHSDREGAFGPVDGPREVLVRSFHEKKLALTDRTNLVDADKERVAVAQSYEREGDLKLNQEDPLAAVAFYLQAEQAYQVLGIREDMDRVRVKLREAGLRSQEHMESITATTFIETSEIDEYIEPLLGEDLRDTLQRIAASNLFIPDLSEAERSAEQTYNNSGSYWLFPKIDFRGEYTVGHHGSDEELRKAVLTDYLVTYIHMAGVFMAHMFDKLEENYGLSAESLLDHFRRWGACKPRNLTLLKRGFERYFAEDYVSAPHILVPQFEDTLRSLLGAANRPVARPLEGTATLGALLDDPAFRDADDEDLDRYCRLVLLEDGLNLRNGIANGLLQPEDIAAADAA